MANIDLTGLKRFNLEDRQLYLDTRVDEASVSSIIKDLNKIIINDDELIKNNNQLLSSAGITITKENYVIPNVYLHVNSFGGSAYDGYGLYSLMKNSPLNIITVGYGEIMSAGVMVFLGGSKRYCYPHTTFMIHSVHSGTWGKLKELEDNVIETKRVNEIYFNAIVSNTKITRQQLDDIQEKKQDWFITADEALKLGIVDKIITK